ncbi:MAG: hypothetical protein II655_06595, partial [Thermoguttaceae bacterium]|nr:hypothetical protein [Thermoguttaceae bacterium]
PSPPLPPTTSIDASSTNIVIPSVLSNVRLRAYPPYKMPLLSAPQTEALDAQLKKGGGKLPSPLETVGLFDQSTREITR